MYKFIFTIVLMLSSSLFSQNGDMFTFSRHAKANALGGAYTGIAEGLEATYYNPAGLAFLQKAGVIYSKGYSGSSIKELVSAEDLGIAIPLPTYSSTIALIRNKINYWSLSENMYQLHYAYALNNSLSFGVNLNYFDQLPIFTSTSSATFGAKSENTYNFGLSMFYRKTGILYLNNGDVLSLGIHLQNLLNNEIEYNNNYSDKQFKGASIGLAYKIEKILTEFELGVLFSTDFKYYRFANDAEVLQPSFGIELSVAKYLFIRFGRNQEEELGGNSYLEDFFPSNRIGVGAIIHVDKFIETNKDVTLELDYTYLDWLNIESSYFDHNLFSIKLYAKLW